MARLLFALPRFHTNMWFAVRRMQADGHAVKLLVNNASKGEDHSLLAPNVLGKYPGYPEVEEIVRGFAPDLVIPRNAWAVSRHAARAARNLRIPMLLYNQLPYTRPTTLLRRIVLRAKRLPAHRVTPVYGLSREAAPDPFARYLPWPVAALPVPPGTHRVADGPLRVLLVGKLGSARKNQIALVDALEAAGLERQVHLTLAGAASRQNEAHLDKVRGLSSKAWVTLAGQLPFQEMAGLYASHDVCILPSFAEPLGTSPIEAMAYGTVPMISTQCGSAGYITHDVDGLLFDPTDLAAAATTLKRLAQDRGALSRLREGALATQARDLSEDRFSANLTALLRESGVA